MRSVKFFVAAGAASLSSSMAFAADMPMITPPPMYAPPPVQDFGGWYLRGDIGFSNQRVKNIAMADGRNAQLLSLQETTAFDTAGVFGVGVGYQFNNWLRGDITGQFRGNSNFKGADVITFPAGGGVVGNGIDNYSASKSEWLILANGYVDLGTWWCITPFVGAGVGMSRVTISNYTDNGIVNQSGFPPVAGTYPSGATAAQASKWNFAWALHTGLAYRVNPNLTLELAYSYVDLGQGTTGPVTDYTGFTRGVPMQFKNITSQDLMFGVRWNLDNPQPAYAPPLVTKG
jgi:opacity protein-like surface antigen